MDFETRSELNLKKVGLHVYAAHHSTAVWVVCATMIDVYGVETEIDWFPYRGEPCPPELVAFMALKPLVVAHNAEFEYTIWREKLADELPLPPFSDFECTAAMAAALSLPRDLGGAAVAMGLDVVKDAAGYRLMLQMCRPRITGKKASGPPTWWDVPAKLERLTAYCRTDVRVEMQLHRKVRPLSDYERQVWLLNQEINDRGVLVDLAAVRNAKRIAAAEVERLNARLSKLTDGRVKKVTNHAFLGEWLRDQGLDVESVDKATVKDALAGTLAPNVREVLDIRQEAARSSLAKLDAFEARTSADGRCRGNLMYHGAGTGRFSGVGVQMQNFLRPWMKYQDLLAAVEAFGLPDAAVWLTIYGKPLDVVANSMRLMIKAAPEHELYISDFANIEGRGLAWAADELPKLAKFEAFDRGEGADLYLLAVAEMLGIPLEHLNEDSPERQIGKVSELSLGYQGGIGAYIKMGANYGVKPEAIAPVIRRAATKEAWEITEERYSPEMGYGLDLDVWTALRLVVDRWRLAHPRITAFWAELEAAAIQAVKRPNTPVRCGKVSFLSTRTILWLRLPSGRLLAYPAPSIREVKTPWGAMKDAVTFMGVDSVTRKYRRANGYGGLWSENLTQGIARDIMVEAMMRMKARGWPLILTVHDELVAELLKALGITKDMFTEEMEVKPAWAAGYPILAKTTLSGRYRK